MYICVHMYIYSLYIYIYTDPWIWTTIRGLPKGWKEDWVEMGKGRKSGNKCNSINSKIK